MPGHWEGDLIIGKNGGSAIATLVERTSRFLLLVHLPGSRTAATLRKALVPALGAIPADLRLSITWDQGGEMALHREITSVTGTPVYFCHPHSPWERGSNENMNGVLRQYFPKSTDLAIHTPERLAEVAADRRRCTSQVGGDGSNGPPEPAKVGDSNPFRLGKVPGRNRRNCRRADRGICSAVTILVFGATESPPFSGLAADADGSAGLDIVHSSAHQQKVVVLLFAQQRRAERGGIVGWLGHSGASSVGPCCDVPEKPGAKGWSLHAGKRQ